MNHTERILLILDLDETLIYAAEQPLSRSPDLVVGPYSVYRRPHLAEILQSCAADFLVAIWSSASDAYVAAIVPEIFPAGIQPVFVWGRSRCVRRFDPETRDDYFVKDLRKIQRNGFSLDRILAVDDTPQKLERNYGNAIYIRPYQGEEEDGELILLARYLSSLHTCDNVRTLEKRGWRHRVS